MAACCPIVSTGQSGKAPVRFLESNGCSLGFGFNQFDYSYNNTLLHTYSFEADSTGAGCQTVTLPDARWEIRFNLETLSPGDSTFSLGVIFKLIEGFSPGTNLTVNLRFSGWSGDNYVLIPGAVYNGNRFEARKIAYSPKLLDPRDIGPSKPVIISDVPRLNRFRGPSSINLRSGAMTLPAIGFRSPGSSTGFLLLTGQETIAGDNGIGITESSDREEAIISVSVPVVREKYKYFIANTQAPSDDRAPDWKTGDEVSLRLNIYFFKARNVQALFNKLASTRNDIMRRGPLPGIFSFSSCFETIEQKFNEQNWVNEPGYYSVGMRENFLQDWQIGWTGGMISTYPLLFGGNPESIQNVIKNFDWLFPDGIATSHFFWDSGEKGNIWYGGDIRKLHTANWHLVRKSGDGLYYIIKQLMLMEKMNITVSEEWKTGTRGVADAFAKLWENNGQFGQFIDSRSGEIIVGGSTSGAIVPAALVLASEYFHDVRYLDIASASAEYYYNNWVTRGITCGGPGDALQNPDSESSYAMLESFMKLFERTGDIKWLGMAGEMAIQFSSWVMPYDYRFPPNSTLGRLGSATTGTVAANTQNTHEAPGICTYSGIALLRLFRATGDEFFIKLLQDIARAMPQYLSHPLRPVDKMKPGWMSERVSTTDWLEGIGELMYGSTWSETSMMLTYIEIPGLYVNPDISRFHVFDHVNVEKSADTKKTMSLRITNPTKSMAEVRILSEPTALMKTPLGENALFNCQLLVLKPGETRELKFRK